MLKKTYHISDLICLTFPRVFSRTVSFSAEWAIFLFSRAVATFSSVDERGVSLSRARAAYILRCRSDGVLGVLGGGLALRGGVVSTADVSASGACTWSGTADGRLLFRAAFFFRPPGIILTSNVRYYTV